MCSFPPISVALLDLWPWYLILTFTLLFLFHHSAPGYQSSEPPILLKSYILLDNTRSMTPLCLRSFRKDSRQHRTTPAMPWCHWNARSTLDLTYDEGCPHRVADRSNCELRPEAEWVTTFVSTPEICTFSSRGNIHAIWCVPKKNYNYCVNSSFDTPTLFDWNVLQNSSRGFTFRDLRRTCPHYHLAVYDAVHTVF